jgi:hypothetical protein
MRSSIRCRMVPEPRFELGCPFGRPILSPASTVRGRPSTPVLSTNGQPRSGRESGLVRPLGYQVGYQGGPRRERSGEVGGRCGRQGCVYVPGCRGIAHLSIASRARSQARKASVQDCGPVRISTSSPVIRSSGGCSVGVRSAKWRKASRIAFAAAPISPFSRSRPSRSVTPVRLRCRAASSETANAIVPSSRCIVQPV